MRLHAFAVAALFVASALQPARKQETKHDPAPVTVNVADAQGAFHVDPAWAAATGFTF